MKYNQKLKDQFQHHPEIKKIMKYKSFIIIIIIHIIHIIFHGKEFKEFLRVDIFLTTKCIQRNLSLSRTDVLVP